MSKIRMPLRLRGKFRNSDQEPRRGFLFHTFLMWIRSLPLRISYMKGSFEDWRAHHDPVSASERPVITWIGHSTFLIQIQGINILTDPIFFNLSFFFRRNLPPGIALADLPPIDVILISHNHWDHMHGPTLMALRNNITARGGVVLVPEGDHHWFMRRKFGRVTPNSWGQDQLVESADSNGQGVKITFLPAWHWSQRGVFDHNKSLWGSWMIEAGGHTIYFAGDTAYSDHFSEIGRAFPSIDIALLPIGPCDPKTSMKHTHVDADEAGQAFLDLGAQCFIPMHWGTFNFGFDRFLTPVERINQWWQGQNLKDLKKLAVFKIGQQTKF